MSSDTPRTKTKKIFAKENEKQFKLLDEKAKEEKKKIDSHKKTRVIGRFSITTTKKPNDSSEKWSDEKEGKKDKESVNKGSKYNDFGNLRINSHFVRAFEDLKYKIKNKIKEIMNQFIEEDLKKQPRENFNSFIEYYKAKRKIQEKHKVNFCCTEKESEMLKKYIKILFRLKPDMNKGDIIIAVIVAYYGLVLGEQTTDYLTEYIYGPFSFNFKKTKALFLELTTGDIMDGDINISKKFRQKTLFGNSSSGGGKKSTRKIKSRKYMN